MMTERDEREELSRAAIRAATEYMQLRDRRRARLGTSKPRDVNAAIPTQRQAKNVPSDVHCWLMDVERTLMIVSRRVHGHATEIMQRALVDFERYSDIAADLHMSAYELRSVLRDAAVAFVVLLPPEMTTAIRDAEVA